MPKLTAEQLEEMLEEEDNIKVRRREFKEKKQKNKLKKMKTRE